MFAMRRPGSPPHRPLQEMLGAAKTKVTRSEPACRVESIQRAVPWGNSEHGRAVDDADPQVTVDSDLARETGIGLEVCLSG